MKQYIYFIAIISFMLTSTACNNKDAGKDVAEQTDEQAEAAAHDEQVFLSNTQMKSIGVELGVIEEKQLTAALKTNGVLRVPNQNRATINAVYNGIIRSILVQPGSSVKKGQVVATVSNPDFVKVQSDYLGVKVKIEMAALEVTRQKELNAGNAGALKNLQNAETELRSLLTASATYEQQIRLMGISPASISASNLVSVLSVRSPISGVVSDVRVEMGAYVDLSTPIAVIVDNSQLHLDLFVYEKDLGKLSPGQTIHFTLTNDPGREYDAMIYSLGSSFEGESKAVTVHARVQGEKTGLIDGMNITAAISLSRNEVNAVPSEAIVTLQGKDYIFVVDDKAPAVHEEKDGHATPDGMYFRMVPVAKGTTDVGYTEITVLEDNPVTGKVVVKGAFFLLAKKTNSGEHGH